MTSRLRAVTHARRVLRSLAVGVLRITDVTLTKVQAWMKGAVMNRRVFLSKTAAATAGLTLAFPEHSRAHASPNEMVNVASASHIRVYAITRLGGKVSEDPGRGHRLWTAVKVRRRPPIVMLSGGCRSTSRTRCG